MPHAQALTLTHDAKQVIDHGISVHVESQPMNLQAARALPASAWQPVHGTINAGYTNATYWYRIVLTNPSSSAMTRLLDIGYPLLDYVEYFATRGHTILNTWTTGDTFPYEQRPMATQSFVFPINLDAHSSQTVYLRVHTEGALQVPLTLWKTRAFHAASAHDLGFRAFFYGMMLLMAIYNGLLYLRIRNQSYIYLTGTVLSLVILLGGLSGFNFRFLYPQLPALHSFLILIMVPVSLVFLCLFAINFLALKRTNLAFYRLLKACVALAGLACLGAFVLPYHISTTFSVYITAPIAISNIGAGLFLWRQRYENGRWYSIAWIGLLIGIIAIALAKLGITPMNVASEYGLSIGATLQILVLSYALGNIYREERGRRLRAQEKSIRAVRRQQEMEQQLLYAASHSEVSNLPNRTLFEHYLQDHLETRHKPGKFVGVVLLHLQRFDDVNKTLGYWNADALIRLVAERLNRLAGQCKHVLLIEKTKQNEAYAAHIEGVRFTFALTGESQEVLTDEIQKVTDALSQPIQFMDLSLDIQFRAGCSFTQDSQTNAQDLLRKSFIAFDQTDGRINSISTYTPEMNPHSSRRLTLMSDLRTAIDTHGLELYFQPQVHLPSKSVAGFEALLRWTHPEYGFIPPDEFIPMAEQTGLIRPLTIWVLRNALKFIKQLDAANSDATVSVNISANNLLEPDLNHLVSRLLRENRIAPSRLVIEVTETAAMTNPANALAMLESLHDIGVKLSIDDFGTGYSSLAYISRLPVQEIKLDRSFIMHMDTRKEDATIVRTTINMCHSLGRIVVAEGVETANIARLLKALDCDFLQGYHIERPRPADTILEWLSGTKWHQANLQKTTQPKPGFNKPTFD